MSLTLPSRTFSPSPPKNSASLWGWFFGSATQKKPKPIPEYPLSVLEDYSVVAEQTLRPTNAKPLKRIALVGVPFTPYEGLTRPRDPFLLQDAFAGLASASIPVSPEAVIIPFDLNLGKRHDFLAPSNFKKVDAVFLCFIAGRDHPERQQNAPEEPGLLLSPFDQGIPSWQTAIERTRAKVVISFSGSPNDVGVDLFRLPHYKDGLYHELNPRASVRPRNIHMASIINKHYAATLPDLRGGHRRFSVSRPRGTY